MRRVSRIPELPHKRMSREKLRDMKTILVVALSAFL
jgi:hypothetical protein